MSLALSGMRRDGLIISSGVVRVGRAIKVRPDSSFLWKTIYSGFLAANGLRTLWSGLTCPKTSQSRINW